MNSSEADDAFGVWLRDSRVGRLTKRGDHTRFSIDESYRDDPEREVLSLYFEDDLTASHSSTMRVPPWFSNLLPEGPTRDLVAQERGVAPTREMELLAHVGRDLPGAVYVLPEPVTENSLDTDREDLDESGDRYLRDADGNDASAGDRVLEWRFSLAGVGIKLSMLTKESRLTMPAHGEFGDWIVKLPHQVFRNLPQNEFGMMKLASLLGVDVPEIRLVSREDLGLDFKYWRSNEEFAYATRRFDRSPDGGRIHIEDLAQVRGFYPDDKYLGNYETVASNFFRGRDEAALIEFIRRLTLNVLIENSDAHLKNWSLIYSDPRTPTIAPAYDIASAAPYDDILDKEKDLALKWANSHRYVRFTLSSVEHLEHRLHAKGLGLADVARETAIRAAEFWPRVRDELNAASAVLEGIDAAIDRQSRRLLG